MIDPVYHYQSINVETQRRSPSSLLNWMRRLIAIRKRYPVFGRGQIEFLHPANLAVLAYIRCGEDQTVLVVNNLSRFVQPVELDLSQYLGHVPVELFGETVFPKITEAPYFLSLGPHTFYWFRLEQPAASAGPKVLSNAGRQISPQAWKKTPKTRSKRGGFFAFFRGGFFGGRARSGLARHRPAGPRGTERSRPWPSPALPRLCRPESRCRAALAQ